MIIIIMIKKEEYNERTRCGWIREYIEHDGIYKCGYDVEIEVELQKELEKELE